MDHVEDSRHVHTLLARCVLHVVVNVNESIGLGGGLVEGLGRGAERGVRKGEVEGGGRVTRERECCCSSE